MTANSLIGTLTVAAATNIEYAAVCPKTSVIAQLSGKSQERNVLLSRTIRKFAG